MHFSAQHRAYIDRGTYAPNIIVLSIINRCISVFCIEIFASPRNKFPSTFRYYFKGKYESSNTHINFEVPLNRSNNQNERYRSFLPVAIQLTCIPNELYLSETYVQYKLQGSLKL